MRRWWVILCAALALAACATAPRPGQMTVVSFRPVESHFSIAGRLSARNGEEAIHGKFEWQHAPGRDQWDFYSPLGQIVARVKRDGDLARLLTAEGEEIAEPFSQLMQRVLGMSVPVAALPRWVQAGVVDTEVVREADALGRPVRIADNGWLVRYLAYADDSVSARPKTIEVSRGDAALKLVVDRWQ